MVLQNVMRKYLYTVMCSVVQRAAELETSKKN